MAEKDDDRGVVREAAERLLDWGFSAPSIAHQLHRSRSWVYAVRRERDVAAADLDEAYIRPDRLLRDLDS